MPDRGRLQADLDALTLELQRVAVERDRWKAQAERLDRMIHEMRESRGIANRDRWKAMAERLADAGDWAEQTGSEEALSEWRACRADLDAMTEGSDDA